jgi:hypothetical protein
VQYWASLDCADAASGTISNRPATAHLLIVSMSFSFRSQSKEEGRAFEVHDRIVQSPCRDLTRHAFFDGAS